MILHTILGLLLLLIPAGALYVLDRKMLRNFIITAVRMGLQLLALCLVVWALFRVDSPWLLLIWLVLTALGSGWLVLKRCKLDGFRLLPAVSTGLFVSVAVVGFSILVGLFR